MRAISPNRAVSVFAAQPDSRTLLLFSLFSFLGHLALFAAMLFSPFLLPEKRYSPSAIQVSMVSLPPGPPTPLAPRQTPAPEAPTAAEPVPPTPEPVVEPTPAPAVSVPEPAPPEPPAEAAVSVAPKPKVYKKKTSLKKKTYKPKKKVKPTVSKKKTKVDSRSEQVSRAIDKLKKRHLTPPAGSNATSGGQGGGGAAGGKAGGEIIDIYKAEIAVRIQNNWAFSKHLAGGKKDISAVIVLKILPSGEIGDSWFEKRSGNTLLDDSAFRAVQKSNPLPPLPKGHFRSFYVVGLIFTPEGIQ